jgi:hypothetical protein
MYALLITIFIIANTGQPPSSVATTVVPAFSSFEGCNRARTGLTVDTVNYRREAVCVLQN